MKRLLRFERKGKKEGEHRRKGGHLGILDLLGDESLED